MLSVDDFEIGMYVTITSEVDENDGEWQDSEEQHPFLLGFTSHTRNKIQYMGEVLQIIAISLPFVAIKALSLPSWKKVVKLDVRNYNWQKLNKEYVNIMKHKEV